MKAVDMHCDTISELYGRRGTSILKNSLHIDLEKMEKGTAQEPYKHDYMYDFEQDVIFHLGADGNIYMYEFV